MKNPKSLTKVELAEIVADIIDEVKNNEGMGIARILADNNLISEEECEGAINF